MKFLYYFLKPGWLLSFLENILKTFNYHWPLICGPMSWKPRAPPVQGFVPKPAESDGASPLPAWAQWPLQRGAGGVLLLVCIHRLSGKHKLSIQMTFKNHVSDVLCFPDFSITASHFINNFNILICWFCCWWAERSPWVLFVQECCARELSEHSPSSSSFPLS